MASRRLMMVTLMADPNVRMVGDFRVEYLPPERPGAQGGHRVTVSDGWTVDVLPEAPEPVTSTQKRSRAITAALTALHIRQDRFTTGEGQANFVAKAVAVDGCRRVNVVPPDLHHHDAGRTRSNYVEVAGTVTAVDQDGFKLLARTGRDAVPVRIWSVSGFGFQPRLQDDVQVVGRLRIMSVPAPSGVRQVLGVAVDSAVNLTTGETL